MTDKVFARCGLSSLFCSTSIASLVQVRAMSSRRSRTRMLDAMAICRHSAARSLHTSEVSMAVTPAAVLPGTPTSLGSAGFPTIEEALPAPSFAQPATERCGAYAGARTPSATSHLGSLAANIKMGRAKAPQSAWGREGPQQANGGQRGVVPV
jgi:hypothetical protein